MNMTIVIISKRSMELALLVAVICGLTIVRAQAVAAAAESEKQPEYADGLPARFETLKDESSNLDGNLLSAITKDLGEDIERTMVTELGELFNELEQQPRRNLRESTHHNDKRISLDEAKLKRLRESNKIVGEHIRDRIELVGDDSGKLPQMSLGSTASSLLGAASQRLASTSSFVGSKLRALSTSVVERIPSKLKRFFRWPSFLNFKMRFHKRYPTLKAELYANFVFLKNQIVTSMSNIRFITRRNSFILGQTQYSDMTFKDYAQTVGNTEGGEDLFELESGVDGAKVMAKLKSLDAAKRSVYGAQPQQLNGQTGANAKRSKRSADSDMMDYDELAETEDEDEMMTDDGAFGDGVNEMDVDEGAFGGDKMDTDDSEIFKLIDEYASGADLSNLDEISNDIDHALRPTLKFDPVDLRNTECVQKPQNQENCGICYAHVATTVATYHNCMATPENNRHQVRLNARFVSDCGRYLGPTDDPPFWIKGCPGGRITKAIRFIREVGVPPFHDYNWAQVSEGILRERSDRCAFPKPANIYDASQWPIPLKRSVFLTDSREVVVKTVADIHLHLKTVGPVVANLHLWPEFKQYAGGVFDKIGPKADGCYHSMLVVGHDYDQQGREIFIVWNSHGTPWGEYGFLKITAEALNYYKTLLVATVPNMVD